MDCMLAYLCLHHLQLGNLIDGYQGFAVLLPAIPEQSIMGG